MKNLTHKALIGFPVLRSFLWRLGRKLYCAARRDVPNTPETNGEYWLLEHMISQGLSEDQLIVDVGANLGNWSERVAMLLRNKNMVGHIHAFEPSRDSFNHCAQRFAGNSEVVRLRNIALSDRTGEAKFFVVGELAGTNSLYGNAQLSEKDGQIIIVAMTTLDEWRSENGIEQIMFVKTDTEGNDFLVMRGAKETIREGAIAIWQFEYNHRWIYARSYMKDVFDFISGTPYRVGKLLPDRVEFYDRWHPELDRFFEGNYVLVRNDVCSILRCANTQFNKSNVISRKVM